MNAFSKFINRFKRNSSVFKLDFGIIVRVYSTLGKDIKWIILAAILCVISVYCDMMIIHHVGDFLDKKTLNNHEIMVFTFSIAFLVVLCRLTGVIQFIMSIYASFRALFNLRTSFFSKLNRLNKTFFDTHKTGWLVSRCTGDLGTLMDFMCFTIMVLAISISYFIITGIKVLNLSTTLILPLFIMLPLPMYLISFFKRRMKVLQRGIKRANSRLISNLAENIKGLMVNQAFAKEDDNQNKFNLLSLVQFNKAIKAVKLNAIYIPLIDLIGIIGIALVMTIGLYLIENQFNSSNITAGKLATIILFLYILLSPVRMLMEVLSITMSAITSAERVFEVMDNTSEHPVSENAVEIQSLRGKIEFSNVDFSYKKDSIKIINNLSFTINPGETVALVGKTGCGKSTIASLIMRFYDVNHGSIKIDDIDIREYLPESLHQQMGMVLQDSFLFSGTVLENLRFANQKLSKDEVIQLAKRLGTHFYIEKLPLGYETVIHEGGSSLSMGQRQIITMTRALIADPDILILDEATSSIDINTENIITQSMNKLIKNRTSIIIAHRLSTIEKVDRIFLIDNGEILEEGSHQELMQNQGRYFSLVGSQ